MIIRKSNKKYALYRYGGTSAGKNIEARIGNVAIGTRPDDVPDDLVQDLTPRELAELRERLTEDERNRLREKIFTLEVDLKHIADAVKSGVLDDQSTAKLGEAVKALMSAMPKARARNRSVTGSTATDVPTPSHP